MELTEATNQILLRLYDWSSMRDFQRELHENGPLLSLIKDHKRAIGGLLLMASSLSPKQREEFAKASVKLGIR